MRDARRERADRFHLAAHGQALLHRLLLGDIALDGDVVGNLPLPVAHGGDIPIHHVGGSVFAAIGCDALERDPQRQFFPEPAERLPVG